MPLFGRPGSGMAGESTDALKRHVWMTGGLCWMRTRFRVGRQDHGIMEEGGGLIGARLSLRNTGWTAQRCGFVQA